MTATATSVQRTGRARTGDGPAAVRVLTRIETRRLLTRPTVLVGGVLSMLAMVSLTWGAAPVLNRDDVTASGSLLVLSGATLLATNAAALRNRRYGTEEVVAPMPAPPGVVTLAVLFSIAPVVLLGALLVGVFFAWRLVGPAVTSPDLLELLTGPTLVALGGCIGVALARWFPSPTIAPIVLVGLAAIEFSANLLTGGAEYGGRIKWLAPFVGQHGTADELLIRPAGWHLIYLLASGIALGCVALIRHEPTRARSVLAAVAGMAVVLSGAAQLRPLGPDQQAAALAAQLTDSAEGDCERRRHVIYCPLPGYEPWIDRWAVAVEQVLAQLPDGSRPPHLTVRQDFLGTNVESLGAHPDEGSTQPTNDEVRPGVWWGRGSSEGPYQFGLALGMAALALGLSPDGAPSPDDGLRACSTEGQARAVLALWLAGQVSDHTAAYLRQEVFDQALSTSAVSGTSNDIHFDWRAAQPVGSLQFGWREAATAVQLLQQPRDQMQNLLHRHWPTLSDPATSSGDALGLLGVPDPAPERPPADIGESANTERGSGLAWRDTPCP